MTTLAEDIPIITNALLLIPLLAINFAIVVGGLIYLGWLSWLVLLTTLGFMVIGIVTYQLPVISALRSFRRAREHADQLMSHFRALTDGAKELKLHRRRRDAFFSEILQSTASEIRKENIHGTTIYTAASSWGQILVFVVIGLVVFLLPTMQNLNAQTITGYTLTLLYLMTPLQVLMNTSPSLGRANIAIKRLDQLGLSLSSHPPDETEADDPEPITGWGRIDLEGAALSYHREDEDKEFTLGPLDLSFYPGEIIFLVGGNGSGKTTLAKLITGLYIPEAGEIRLDGKPVTDQTREYYRQHFSVVFSDCYLFNSFLGLMHPKIDEQARGYLSRLQLDQKVKIENGVLSTIELSQGQRKRLALLTAYLEDRPIYLFDEWAADQDPMFKQVFYYELLPELKARGKTVFVISHDDRYYKLADRIIKLDYGKIECDQAATPLQMHIGSSGCI
jgi:putative ATP-binding cassette transporter